MFCCGNTQHNTNFLRCFSSSSVLTVGIGLRLPLRVVCLQRTFGMRLTSRRHVLSHVDGTPRCCASHVQFVLQCWFASLCALLMSTQIPYLQFDLLGELEISVPTGANTFWVTKIGWAWIEPLLWLIGGVRRKLSRKPVRVNHS